MNMLSLVDIDIRYKLASKNQVGNFNFFYLLEKFNTEIFYSLKMWYNCPWN